MPRTPEYDRAEALSAAMDVFWQYGYEASSIQKLLDAMKINRGSLYSAFTDKQTLFKSTLDLYAQGIQQMVEQQIIGEDPSDPIGSLQNFFENAFLDQSSDAAANGCLLFNTVTELSSSAPDLAIYAKQNIKPVRDMFNRYIHQAIELDLIAGDSDAETLTESLLAFLAGLRVLCKMGVDDQQRKKIIHTTLCGLFK